MNDKVKIIELNEASSLAKIIGSKTAQNIISYIGEHEKCTASQIKTDLNLPASTVHYNIKALIESEIIDDSQFTYSSKGKQVNHYTLTNKILIVVPKKQDITSQLRAFIPGLLVVGVIIGFSFILKLFKSGGKDALFKSANLAAPTMMDLAVESEAVAENTMLRSAEVGSFSAQNITSTSIPWYNSPDFFIGLGVACVCLIGTYFLVKLIQKRKNKNQK